MLFMVRIVFHRGHSTCKCSIYNLSHVCLSLCLSVSLLLLLSVPRGQRILQSDIHIFLRLRRALRPSIRIFLPQKNHNNLNLPISRSHHLPQSLRLSCLCDVVVNSQMMEPENSEEMGISAVSQSGSCAQVLPMERPCVGISILVSITILCTLFFLFKRICCPRNHSVHFVATT